MYIIHTYRILGTIYNHRLVISAIAIGVSMTDGILEYVFHIPHIGYTRIMININDHGN